MKFADRKMPVISEGRQMADAGALLTYAPNYYEMYPRAAAFVDKILKGGKAGDIPVEQPMKFELIVNLRTAKSLKITAPDSILLRADRIIR